MKSRIIAVVVSLVCMFLPASTPAGTLYAGQPRAITDSAGGFLLTQVWKVTSTPSVALGDINEDGSLDALISAEGHKLWLNDGEGNFVASDLGMTMTGHLFVVALADLNGDTHLDLVVGGLYTDHSSGVWLNDGTGHFQFSQELFDGSNDLYDALELGDINKDGYPDMVLGGGEGGFGSTRSFLWLNDGTGHFTKSILLPYGAMAFGDVNGDTDVDLLVGYADQIQLWTNTGTGTLTNTAQISLGGGCGIDYGGLALGDIDHDTDLDLVIANHCPNDAFWVNDGLGHFQNSGQTKSGQTNAVVLGDFNQDGYLDALFAGAPSVMWLNDEHGHFSRSQSIGSKSIASIDDIVLGDVTGDGYLDALVSHETGWDDNSPGTVLWQWVTALHNIFLPLTPRT